jgi:hypothetical protein
MHEGSQLARRALAASAPPALGTPARPVLWGCRGLSLAACVGHPLAGSVESWGAPQGDARVGALFIALACSECSL